MQVNPFFCFIDIKMCGKKSLYAFNQMEKSQQAVKVNPLFWRPHISSLVPPAGLQAAAVSEEQPAGPVRSDRAGV